MRVLQLSTYPIVEPLHGGQIRVNEIRNKLIACGCEVLSLSVCEGNHSQYHPQYDFITRPPNRYGLNFCSDLSTADMATENKEIYQFLLKSVLNFSPDVIFLEQGWLWPFVKSLLADNILKRENVRIIYSSHNIEYQIKQDILSNVGDDEDKIAAVVQKIKMIETDLTKNADRVICVTQEDANVLSTYSQQPPIVCMNGVARRTVSAADKAIVLDKTQHRPYLIFCGSAYPPNAQGFWRERYIMGKFINTGKIMPICQPVHHQMCGDC
jgi:hypothetical protein